MTGDSRAHRWPLGDLALPVYSMNTLVVGSGAAARNAALQLLRLGLNDLALVTERWNAGTSFDAGSDKQTYYKLALGGSGDSPLHLARDLWAGGCMHGDIALCEALGSARAFFNLVELGVPFPHDRHGGYPGYRTDNDTRGRATSAGPLTSRMMCKALGSELQSRGLKVFDLHQVVALLTRPGQEGEEGRVACGALAISRNGKRGGDFGLVVFNARNVVLATGGPGGMYRDSVYPQSQRGSTGMALRAGVVAHNLTESQFGIASVGFRWNLSGSYQQVVPRYVSTAREGGEEREFLNPHFPDMATLASATFRKGYEWPFDAGRVANHGSSLIDLLVHREIRSGRRVFLDYTHDPQGGDGLEPFTLKLLDAEAREYLRRSGALGKRPIDRLLAMNEPAVQLFREHGTDLAARPLEIAVCAQHNNGGLRANIWWESSLPHLFPVGEVCGTHGIRRPGGAALNAGQVGGGRAALFIVRRYAHDPPPVGEFTAAVAGQVEECLDFCRGVLGKGREGTLTPARVIAEVQERMSLGAAHVRDLAVVRREAEAARTLLRRLPAFLRIDDPRALTTAFWATDLCLAHWVYLEAIRAYLEAGGRSRGSVLVLDPGGDLPVSNLEEGWRFSSNSPGAQVDHQVLEVWVEEGNGVGTRWVPVRPIPWSEGWFEEVWKDFREDRVVR